MTTHKDRIVIALKKARSSVDRTLATVERGDTACFAALQQNLAAIGLLKAANTLMLERHVEDVLTRGLKGRTAREVAALRDELVRVVAVAQKK